MSKSGWYRTCLSILHDNRMVFEHVDASSRKCAPGGSFDIEGRTRCGEKKQWDPLRKVRGEAGNGEEGNVNVETGGRSRSDTATTGPEVPGRAAGGTVKLGGGGFDHGCRLPKV